MAAANINGAGLIAPLNAYKPAEAVEEIQLRDLTDRTARNVLDQTGRSADPARGDESNVLDHVARTVMRHPSPEAMQLLNTLHRRLSDTLVCYSDAALTWLLGGSNRNAHGGFRDSFALIKFLETKPETMEPEQLIQGLETILTAMSYRAVRATWCPEPIDPKVENGDPMTLQMLLEEITELYRQFAVPAIQQAYPERLDKCAEDAAINDEAPEATPILRRRLSDVSQNRAIPSNLAEPLPAPALPTANGPHKSWTGVAAESGIPVRATPSGTWPLCLSMACGLILGKCPEPEIGPDGRCTPEFLIEFKKISETAQLLTGVMGIPAYLRGDFHTPAETAAGFVYFLMVRKGLQPKKAFIQPVDAIHQATHLMVAATAPEIREQIDMVPLEVRNFSARKKLTVYQPDPNR